MTAFYPVATTGTSNQLFQKRLLTQFAFDRSELLRLQDQLSTGLRITVPSDDAPASLRAVGVQRLLEQRDQAATNIDTSRSYLSATDSALNGVSDLLIDIRGEALTLVNGTTTDHQRETTAELVSNAVQEMVRVSNRTFRGRPLFSGSDTEAPFRHAGPFVRYTGNEVELKSLLDNDFTVATNVNGNEVFGAISSAVRGTIDLNPVLTEDTKLSDLRGGEGITRGSFLVSDGNSTAIVDISHAETIGDVARAIESTPPDDRTITVDVTTSGLVVDIDDEGEGNLTIREVRPGGTVAAELGILNPNGVGFGQIIGRDVDPTLLPTTPLRNVLGTRASAVLQSAGAFNDIAIEAVDNGDRFNDVDVRFVQNLAAGDQAFANYDEATQTLEIDVNAGATTAATVVAAINTTGVFSAELNTKTDPDNDGSGEIEFAATASLAGGSGTNLDQASGIQIVNGAKTYTIEFGTVETVEEFLNLINVSGAGAIAKINDSGTGIDVRSTLSGTDFQIGENGGTTASDLGIRTFTRETALAELNYGRGIDRTGGVDPEVAPTTGPHVDFVIERKDGVSLDVDLRSAVTVGDVIDAINNHADNTGDAVVARLSEYGNGLEIYDANASGTGTLTVTRGDSFAAGDLGLLSDGETTDTASSATQASAAIAFNVPNDLNTAFTVTATQSGFSLNDVDIEFRNTLVGDAATATFDAADNRLVVDLDATQSTANTVVAAVTAEGTFTAVLDSTVDLTNDGSGIVGNTGVVGVTAGGAAERFQGRDVNPQETQGVFTSLLRLQEALIEFNPEQVARAIDMLDIDFERLNFVRAELGQRIQSIDRVDRRIESEEIELRSALSNEIDSDIVEVISELTARQANLEATLRLVGRTLQLTLIDFI